MSLARNSRDSFPPLPRSHLLRGNPGQKSGSRQVKSCAARVYSARGRAAARRAGEAAGPAAPGAAAPRGAAARAPGGAARGPRRRADHRRRRPGRRPGPAAALRARAAAASWEPPPPPRGRTRVHTCRGAARGSPGVPRVSPGRGGSPEPRPHSPGIPRAPRFPRRVGCRSRPVRGEGSARAGGGGPPRAPARPTRKPAAAPRAAAHPDLNTPARAGRVPRAGCARGALASDPRGGNGGLSSA